MTLTIDLTPEQSARLQQAAKARGIDVPAVVRDLIEHLPETMSPQAVSSGKKKARSFRAWAESNRRDTPLLSEEDISREAIYGERG
jgi:hypothetical protein